MKQRLEGIFKGPVVFYPLLFAVFPILFLYAYNIGETSPNQIWLPMVISVAATLVLWVVLSVILRSLAKAGFATAIFLVFFFAYGRFYDALINWGAFPPKHAYLFPTMLFVWGYSVYFIGRAKTDFRVATRLLNIVAVVLVAINLFTIVSYQARLGAVTPVESAQHTAATNPAESNALPDIYFIILDEYAHPDTMREWYDYDNSAFIEDLEDRGFFIADRSKTRTPNSNEVLAQVLNMEYLTEGYYWDETAQEYRENTTGEVKNFDDRSWLPVLFNQIVDSKVADFLKAQGYQHIYFGSWFEHDSWESDMEGKADLYFNCYDSGGTSAMVTEFVRTLWNTTMLSPFYHYLAGNQYEDYHRRGMLATLKHLEKVPDIEGPKFAFVHLMCPHSPFVFGPAGQSVAPMNRVNLRDRQFYLGQYIFISGEIENVVAQLLKKSKTPPIIILQSDHGPRPQHPGIEIDGDEWEKILNAMYLPGMDYAELSDSISPVNTFRLIFSHYFGADYPLLEND